MRNTQSARLRGGVDLGGTKIQTAVIGEAGKVVGQARERTPTTGGPPDVAAAIARTMRAAAADAGVEVASLSGVGVGSPGDIVEGEGVVSQARNLPGWEGSFPLGQRLVDVLLSLIHI